VTHFSNTTFHKLFINSTKDLQVADDFSLQSTRAKTKVKVFEELGTDQSEVT